MFNSRWYLSARKSPYAIHPVSDKFPQCGFWNSSNISLIEIGHVSSVQGISSTATLFYASLDVVNMFLALCPPVVSHTPEHFRSSETQSHFSVMVALHASLSARSCSLTPACLGSVSTTIESDRYDKRFKQKTRDGWCRNVSFGNTWLQV